MMTLEMYKHKGSTDKHNIIHTQETCKNTTMKLITTHFGACIINQQLFAQLNLPSRCGHPKHAQSFIHIIHNDYVYTQILDTNAISCDILMMKNEPLTSIWAQYTAQQWWCNTISAIDQPGRSRVATYTTRAHHSNWFPNIHGSHTVLPEQFVAFVQQKPCYFTVLCIDSTRRMVNPEANDKILNHQIKYVCFK